MPFYFNFETSMTFTRKIWMAFNLFELSLEVTSSRLMTFFFERIWNWAGESRLENKFDKLMMMGQWEMVLIYLLIRLLHFILRVSNELLEVTSYWNLRDKNIEKRIIKKLYSCLIIPVSSIFPAMSSNYYLNTHEILTDEISVRIFKRKQVVTASEIIAESFMHMFELNFWYKYRCSRYQDSNANKFNYHIRHY